MYAVVNTGGKQAKAEQGAVIAIEKLDAEVGSSVTLPVLFVADGERVLATPSELASVVVTAEVVEHFKGDKQIVFKFQKRKGYKRTKGHRQSLTAVRIVAINLDGKPAKAAPKAEAKPAAAPKPKVEPKLKADAKPAAVPKAEAKPKADAKPAAEKPKAEVAAAAEEQCAAIKSDGTRCTNKAKEGSKYCGVHAKKYEG